MIDRIFGRKIEFDERSRQFPIRALLPPKPLRSYTWRVYDVLDQGSEGSCVGHGWAHELMARPVVIQGVTHDTAVKIYNRAQELDEWPGESYEGTSVLAGAKAVMEIGFLKEYRWAFSLDDALMTLGYHGPGVAGLVWYEGMCEPDEKGFIHPTGDEVGGHCILIHGINVKGQYVKLCNSWGKNWGINGECYLSFADFKKLLKEDGEFCVPVTRAKGA